MLIATLAIRRLSSRRTVWLLDRPVAAAASAISRRPCGPGRDTPCSDPGRPSAIRHWHPHLGGMMWILDMRRSLALQYERDRFDARV